MLEAFLCFSGNDEAQNRLLIVYKGVDSYSDYIKVMRDDN